jgi:hypothetical protein
VPSPNSRGICMPLVPMSYLLSQLGPAVPTCTSGPMSSASYDWPNCATGADQETCDAVCNCGFVPTSGGAPKATCNAKRNEWSMNTNDNRGCEAGEWARAWCLGDTRVDEYACCSRTHSCRMVQVNSS